MGFATGVSVSAADTLNHFAVIYGTIKCDFYSTGR